MKEAGQNTLEWITGDSVWNEVYFDAKLFRVWLLEPGNAPVVWTPSHIWVWAPPADPQPWRSINLRDYCQPQSFMVRFWHVPKNGVVLKILRDLFVLASFWRLDPDLGNSQDDEGSKKESVPVNSAQ